MREPAIWMLVHFTSKLVSLRGSLPSTKHTHAFDLPVSAASDRKYANKAEPRRVILELRALGWSYREIGREVGLHWTRVGQILERAKGMV
jgi:hypothetical protein